MLTLNALIERPRAGAQSAGFCGAGAGAARRWPSSRDDRARAGGLAHQPHRQPDELDQTHEREVPRRAPRVPLAESNFRVIAASARVCSPSAVPLSMKGGRSGFYHDNAFSLVAYHATPGYETIRGLAGSASCSPSRPKFSSASDQRCHQNPSRRCPSRPWPRNRISATDRIRSAARRTRSSIPASARP